MKLLIGLGNPGERYKNNRHNAGKMFVNTMGDVGGVRVVGSENFMNDSGKFVKGAVGNLGDLGDLWIAHDDLDLRLGTYKIQFGVGPKVHNGVRSVEDALNTKDFWRIRIGVDNRDSQNRVSGEDYVLQNFSDEELVILNKVFDEIVKDRSFPV